MIPGDALAPTRRPLVLDTNIVLDLFVFQDPVTAALRQLIARRQAEAAKVAQRSEQRATDEFAARAHLRRTAHA